MAISRASVLETLKQKGFECTNISDYKVLDTPLHLICPQGHEIMTTFRTARDGRFKCYACEGKESLGSLIFSTEPPAKSGKRIVAIDNATNHAGIAVFDGGRLVHHELKAFSGSTIDRLLENRHYLQDTIIKKWKPDFVVLEDIQCQQNIKVFKILAMLLGSTITTLKDYDIMQELVPSAKWRAHFMIHGNRIEDKVQAIDKVMQMYGFVVSDDVAEAILLGKYAVDQLNTTKLIKLF